MPTTRDKLLIYLTAGVEKTHARDPSRQSLSDPRQFFNFDPDKVLAGGVIPTKAHPTDFGADLTATSREIDDYGNIVYGFGLAVEIPKGHVGLIFPRSSIAKKNLLLSNSVGCVDADYRGEIMAKFKPSICIEPTYSDIPVPIDYDDYRVGDRVAQLAILPYPEVTYEETDELSQTERGAGGYGSTGK